MPDPRPPHPPADSAPVSGALEAEAVLVARIAEGSKDAMEEFFRLFQTRVYRFALSRLNEASAASDVLSDVMMEVWRHAGRFEGRSKVSTWVFGIARYKVLDRFRAAGRDGFEPLSERIEDPSAADPIAGLAAVQDAKRVQRCLEQLSSAQRQVVHLAFFEDLPYAEIAEIAGCPTGTVKTRMFHAKRALRRCLEGIGKDEDDTER